jgi:hypothetical protein
MRITLLEIKTAFGPEDTAAMTTAFKEALKRLNVADRETPMATSVAKKIVRLAKRGECNPTRLTEGVISSFRANPEIAPEPAGHGLPLSKCEAYNRVYEQPCGSS